MNCKRIIPDAITSCNLLCGSIAVFLATQGAFLWAFVFILAGAFFDFFDGLSARALKEKPEGYQEPEKRERGSRPERGERPRHEDRDGARLERGPRPERRGPRPEKH